MAEVERQTDKKLKKIRIENAPKFKRLESV